MTALDYLLQAMMLFLGMFLALSGLGLTIAGLFSPRAGTWSQYALASCAFGAAYYLLTAAFTTSWIGT
jgi:hypothetical protein